MGSYVEVPVTDDELVDDDDDDGELVAGDSDGELVAGDDEGITTSRREQRFIVLSEKDISDRQEEDISKVTEVLSVSREEACVLLHHYKWDISKLNDEWFTDEEKIRNIVGLCSSESNSPRSRMETCGICFERYSSNKMSSAGCAHFYCNKCWQGYISSAISDGPGCLSLRCPEPSCGAMVLRGIIDKFANDEDKKKYATFFRREYLLCTKKAKWCPAPDCNCAVEFLGYENYDVSCNCKFSFCWNCTEDAHRPVDCETVSLWNRCGHMMKDMKNNEESKNMNWILANSKPCPKCLRPIEKNQGCMHMTCTPPCKFEFCWLCLGAWSDHGERTGGFYACNRYESAKKKGFHDEARSRRKMSKNLLKKYLHYYQRFASNQSSRQKAQADLQIAENEQLPMLYDIFGIPKTQLKFITEAWSQIIECRRVLKWTYVYGFFLDDKFKRNFFEYLQGEAETGLERLHHCAEIDIAIFLPSPNKSDSVEPTPSATHFDYFRRKLAWLTSVTRKYFENLVQALETGLEDVRSTGQASTSKKAGTKAKSVKQQQHVKPSSDHSEDGSSDHSEDGSSDHSENGWPCERCTFLNPPSVDVCNMCEKTRYY